MAEVSIAFRLNARLKVDSPSVMSSRFLQSLNCLSAECSIESVAKLEGFRADWYKSQLPFG